MLYFCVYVVVKFPPLNYNKNLSLIKVTTTVRYSLKVETVKLSNIVPGNSQFY